MEMFSKRKCPRGRQWWLVIALSVLLVWFPNVAAQEASPIPYRRGGNLRGCLYQYGLWGNPISVRVDLSAPAFRPYNMRLTPSLPRLFEMHQDGTIGWLLYGVGDTFQAAQVPTIAVPDDALVQITFDLFPSGYISPDVLSTATCDVFIIGTHDPTPTPTIAGKSPTPAPTHARGHCHGSTRFALTPLAGADRQPERQSQSGLCLPCRASADWRFDRAPGKQSTTHDSCASDYCHLAGQGLQIVDRDSRDSQDQHAGYSHRLSWPGHACRNHNGPTESTGDLYADSEPGRRPEQVAATLCDSAIAPAQGTEVTLASDGPTVFPVPDVAVIPAGSACRSLVISVGTVETAIGVTVTATFPGGVRTGRRWCAGW